MIATADEILDGRWTVLGVARKDIDDPDWFFDPVTGRRAPHAAYCFRIDHRDEQVTGKCEAGVGAFRLHHVTVLAAAFALSRDERYADRAAVHLVVVGAEPLSVRRALDQRHRSGFTAYRLGVGAAAVGRVGWRSGISFEENDDALIQIWWHQRYLANFRSRGSSANNHVMAEAAGQLIGALAFDWFEESEKWADRAARLLEDELGKNTFPSGVNREMAFDYHGFVAELGLLAAAEADRAGRPLSGETWETLGRMLDVVAAVVDVRLHAPRQGDSDDGRALVLGPPDANRWASLLALGASCSAPRSGGRRPPRT